MKYIFLLIILMGLATGLYYALAEYENLAVITNSWEISKEKIVQGFYLIKVEDESTRFYQFTTANGFFNIAKDLWFIGLLFIIITTLLLPFSIYLIKRIWNADISEAIKTKHETQKLIKQYKEKCDLKISEAYELQLNIVKNELASRTLELEQREHSITEREKIANSKINAADAALVQYKDKYQRLKVNFEERERILSKARNNAVATMNRIKNKK